MKHVVSLFLLLGSLTLAAPVPGTMSGGALPFLPETGVPETREPGAGVPEAELSRPEVSEPDTETPEARDVGVAELPLLVTDPPEETPEVDIPAPVTGGADSTFNPFTPLVLPEPEGAGEPGPLAVTGPVPGSAPPEATAPIPAPTPARPAAETAAAPAPPADPVPVPAPAPQARLGTTRLPTALTARLQRAATRSVLGTGILERTLNSADETVSDSAAVAAIRTPPSLTPTGAAAPGRGDRAALGPVSLMGLAGSDGNLTGGGNRVSRSLSDLRVAFSAMATGTGVFRVGDDAVAVFVAVGDRLPGTDLVLSRLTASSAQFTEDDVRHTLLLNP